MAKLNRLTAKIFGETASTVNTPKEIGQFGSAKAGTYNATSDVATIQSLPAWSNGWIDAVTPTDQFPPLPEMTGVHKVLSYQNAYLLQQGMPEWDSATTYYTNGFCSKAGKIYISQSDNNLNNDPETDTVNWKVFESGGARNIGEIVFSTTPQTDAGLHLVDGALISGSGIYSNFVDHMANIYDTAPKYSNVGKIGSLTDIDGVLSGFSTSNYAILPQTFNPQNTSWEAVIKFKQTSSGNSSILCGATGAYMQSATLNDDTIALQVGDGTNWIFTTQSTLTISNNVDYWCRLKFTGTQYLLDISTDGENYTNYITQSSTQQIPSCQLLLGISRQLIAPLQGSIDLNESYININGSRWWTGMQPSWATDEAQWQTSATNYGVCGKFVYDSVNNTVRLPKYNSKIYTGGGTAPVVGNGISLGFTNGTQNLAIEVDYSTPTGYFIQPDENGYGTPVGSNYGGSAPTTDRTLGITTDGTKSGIIADLANITTSLDGYYYIVIATTTKTDIQVDIDQIATDLNGKADVDLSNTNPASSFATLLNTAGIRTVVETYVNGTSWYRVFSDGWCEQGGRSTSPTGTIDLLKPYANSNYSITIAVIGSSGAYLPRSFDTISNITTSNFYTDYQGYSSGSGSFVARMWQASGYIS